METGHKFTSVEEYFSSFPAGTREILEGLRNTIKKAAPKAVEVISYNMPAFKLNNSILVYYVAYKKHIGLYPHGSPIVYFKDELAKYKTSKGAIQFPIDERLPSALITKIVKFRIAEDTEKALLKAGKKK